MDLPHEEPDDERPQLWYAIGSHAYFAIPRGEELAPGDLVIRSIRGARREVDREAVHAFAIPREEATRRLQEDAARALGHARDSLVRLFDLASQLPGSDERGAERIKHAIQGERVTRAIRGMGHRIERILESPELERAVDDLGSGLRDMARKIREGRGPAESTREDPDGSEQS